MRSDNASRDPEFVGTGSGQRCAERVGDVYLRLVDHVGRQRFKPKVRNEGRKPVDRGVVK
jgi:hypothetical protein